jgi:hypothetical protein
MAIKNRRENPVIILDCAIVAVDRKTYTDRSTGQIEDRGRVLTIQTGSQNSDQLELAVPADFDALEFEQGTRILVNAEYSEYSFQDSGRTIKGSTMKYHSHVSHAQLDAWKGVVASQSRAAATA